MDEVKAEDVAEDVTDVLVDVFVLSDLNPLVVEELCVDTVDEVDVLDRTESVDTMEDEVAIVLEDAEVEPF